MSILNELEKTKAYLRHARKAILGRGGEISATAGLKDLPGAIFNIPADSSLAYYTDDASAYRKTVPSGVEEYAQLMSVGGMTRIEISPNLVEEASANGVACSPRCNEQELYLTETILHEGWYRTFYKKVSSIEETENKNTSCGWMKGSNGSAWNDTEWALPDLFYANEGDAITFYCGAVGEYGESIDVVVYPMLYAVPDESEAHILTEFIPYGAERIAPSPVTEIVSKNASGEVLETVAIPDAVKNDSSWGYGTTGKYVKTGGYGTLKAYNTYIFSNKTYTKMLSDIIVLDGNNIKFVSQSGRQFASTISLANLLDKEHTVIAISSPFTHTTPWNTAEYNSWMQKTNFICILPSTVDGKAINNITDANNWLKERKANNNPVMLQIALNEPIVTPIEDNSLAPKLIKVEGGGDVEFGADVPSSIKYVKKVGS